MEECLRGLSLLVLIAITSSAYASDHRQLTIQVVDTRTSERQYSYYVPGTAAKSTTDCDSNAIANSSGSVTNINGTTNCTTTTTPGTAPQRIDGSIAQAQVHAILPDGMHASLWCQAGFRRCSILQPGPYTAEIKGNSVWVYTFQLDGKPHKVKYHFVGGW